MLEPAFSVHQGNDAVGCAGEGPRTVQNLLQHVIQFEAFVDAQTGLCQGGQAFPQGADLMIRFGVVAHC